MTQAHDAVSAEQAMSSALDLLTEGIAHYKDDRYSLALECLQQASRLIVSAGQEVSLEHGVVLSWIAEVRLIQGNGTEAVRFQSQVVEMVERAAAGPDHLFQHLADLVRMQRQVSSPAAVETAQRMRGVAQVLDSAEKRLAVEAALAGALLDAGRAGEALTVCEAAAALYGAEELVEFELAILHTRGLAEEQVGQGERAVRTLEAVVQRRKEVLGRAAHETLETMRNLANVLERLGRHDDAERTLREAEQIARFYPPCPAREWLECLYIGAAFKLARGQIPEAIAALEKVTEECESRFGANDVNTLMALAALGRTLYEAADLERAEAMERRVLSGWKEVAGRGDSRVVEIACALAITLCDRGHIAEAARLLHDELADIDERTLPLATRSALAGARTRIEIVMGGHPTLVDHVRTLVQELDSAGGAPPELLECMGTLLLLKGDPGSVEWCRRAYERRQTDPRGGPRELSALAMTLGHALLEFGQMEQAGEYLAAAMRISESLPGARNIDALRVRGAYGLWLMRSGRYWAATEVLGHAYDGLRTTLAEDHPDVLRTATDLAFAWLNCGNVEAAGSRLRSLYALARNSLGEHCALTVLIGGALCAAMLRQDGTSLNETKALHEQVLALHEAVFGQNNPKTLMMGINTARLSSDLGDLAGAEQLQRDLLARAISFRGEGSDERLAATSVLSATLMLKGEYAQAGNEIENALNAPRAHRSAGHPLIMTLESMAAAANFFAGRWIEAEEGLSRSLRTLEQVRENAGGEVGRAWAADSLALNEIAVMLAIAKRARGRDTSEIVDVLERGTSRAIFDLFDRGSHDWAALAHARAERGLWSVEKLRAFRLASQAAVPATGADTEDQAQARAELASLRRELVSGARSCGLTEIRSVLRPGELLLLYGWTEFGVIVAAVSREAESAHVLSRDAAQIRRVHRVAQAVRSGLMGTSSESSLAGNAAELMGFILPEALHAQVSRAQRIIVSPAGPLRDLPIDVVAELAGVGPLTGKAVTWSLSGSILVTLRERPAPSGRGAVVVGDPRRELLHHRLGRKVEAAMGLRSADRLQPLPRARTEAADVAELLKATDGEVTVLCGNNGTARRLFIETDGARYVHLAAHAVLGTKAEPLGSAVMLAAESESACAPLNVETLLAQWTDRLAGCELITLSCCRTGNGVAIGDSVLALPMAFLQVGARCVMATMWKVNDTATWLLMRQFYRFLLGLEGSCKGNVPASLAQARTWLRELPGIELVRLLEQSPLPHDETHRDTQAMEQRLAFFAASARRPFAHPRYWGAFVVIGNPGP